MPGSFTAGLRLSMLFIGLTGGSLGCSEFLSPADSGQGPRTVDDGGLLDAGDLREDGGAVDAGDVDAGEVDAGAVDAGEIDAGAVDAGEVDAGEIDAGEIDAGEVDGGDGDAGEVDAGEVDAGPPPFPCGPMTETFYDTHGVSDPGPVGELLRCEFLNDEGEEPLVPGYVGFRVVYRTSTLIHENGTTTEVTFPASGLAYVPVATSLTPRPLIANTHGTTGWLPACGPSRSRSVDAAVVFGAIAEEVPGAVVVAPGYAGLGVDPGGRAPDADFSMTDPLNIFQTLRPVAGVSHPYLSIDGEGRATVDLVRAARQLPGAQLGATPRWMVLGQSQGGHGALATGEVVAGGYGDDTDLFAVIAGAPASELDTFAFYEPDILRIVAPITFAGLSIENRDVKVSEYFSGRALAAMAHTSVSQCLNYGNILQIIATSNTYFFPNFGLTRIYPPTDEVAREIALRNTPGYRPTAAPVFIGQVTGDPFVDHRRTQLLLDRVRESQVADVTSCLFTGRDLQLPYPQRAVNHDAFGRMFAGDAADTGACFAPDGAPTTTTVREFLAEAFSN